MKKIIFTVVLGLLLQVSATNANAAPPSYGDGYSGAQIAFAIVFGFVLQNGESNSNNIYTPKEQTVTQAEFINLNSKVETLTLLNQTAGGSLDTIEIIK